MNDRVWIRTSIEQMNEQVVYDSIDRADWDAMTEVERADLIEEIGHINLNNAGGYGVGLVEDESEVPDELKDTHDDQQ